MRSLRLAAIRRGIVVTGLAVTGATSVTIGQTYSCMAAQDSQAVALKSYVVRLVTAPPTDTLLSNTRSRYNIPAGSASAVSIETGKKKCESAAKGYHQALHPGTPQVGRAVVVIKVGNSRYVVLDPSEPAGEFQVHVVLDNHWNLLAIFTG